MKQLVNFRKEKEETSVDFVNLGYRSLSSREGTKEHKIISIRKFIVPKLQRSASCSLIPI